MSDEQTAKNRFFNLMRYTWTLITVWTLILAGFMSKEYVEINRYADEMALSTARAHLNKDFSFRLWGWMHGGVYVPVMPGVQPNPYLANYPERDITTPSGRKLTLMNPEYMLRNLNETFSELYGVAAHLTSLKPLRPENGPDPWEAKTLHEFESGLKEKMEVVRGKDGKQKVLRLMQPLYVKQECLKCHGHQGYKLGDIRGGLDVSLPMGPFLKRAHAQLWDHFYFVTVLWLMGCIGLLVGSERLRKNTQALALSNVGMQREIEERKRVEVALQKESSFTAAVLDTAGALIMVLNVRGEIIRFNQTSESVTGYQFQEVAGRPFWDIILPPEEREPVARLFAGIQSGSLPQKLTKPLVTRGHRHRFIDWANTTFRDDDGNVEYIISIGIDITEERLLQSQLLHAEKLSAIGKLSASIAHEINNPLFGIRNVIERLREKGSLSEDNREFADLALLECDRIRDLIKDLQNFNRPTTGVSTPVNLHKAINHILLLSNKEMKSKHVRVNTVYDKDLGEIMAIADQLKQVFLNLMNNALEAMPSGGQITITTQKAGQEAVITFSDTGVGIPEEVIGHIFEPFFTTKPAVKGTGLGLSISYGIIKHHGGHIEAASAPGQGATFTITLPIEGKNA